MRHGRTGIAVVAVVAATLAAGCKGTPKPESTKIQMQKGVEQAGHTEMPGSPVQHDGLTIAESAYKRGEFDQAGGMFEDIADDTKNRPEVAERARFYQGECLRREGRYPKAVDVYNKLLIDFPAGLYREQAVGQMYAIAVEWLKPVADEIAELSKPEKDRKGTSWTDGLIPANFDRKMPTFDAEGNALKTLFNVYTGDPTGAYADKALFMLGRVHFHRQNFKESAPYFQQLAENYDRSPLRDEALKMAIIAKNNASGGAQYDGKDYSEAIKLINAAKASSPVLAREQDGKFLDTQALTVRYRQAEKDYETAELYRRTGHPGSAWFCYELVLRRYPGMKPWCDLAADRQKELKAELDAAKQPTTFGATRRIWKQYVLGHESPTEKPANATDVKLPDAPRPAPLPPGVATGDNAPRQ